MPTIQQILTKYWGYTSFRPLQEEIINSILEGKDTLALLPTGGGKSICYQVPAMAEEGVCIVVSPLIALMKDQVQNLRKKGINATAIVSGMHRKDIDTVLDNCIYGKIKFLYLSPERLTSELVRERIKKMNVCLLAVDESHCISQWGYDFRPPYLQIAEIREFIPDTPVLAVTATATREVVDDIQEKLEFKEKHVLRKSFERKNLAYVVLQEQDKLRKMVDIARKVPGSAVVYVRNRKKTEEIAGYFQKNNISADYYHAGLEAPTRSKKQEAWIANQSRIMVATNAFGMGIDKPDVRFVIHLDLPDSLEAYFQEAGRGGRDGKKAYAVLLYNDSDRMDLEQRVILSFPPVEEIKKTYCAIANYYQLATGSGKGVSFNFDITEICHQYDLSTLTVFNSLKFLEKEGYFALSDAVFVPSKVKVTANKQELYTYQVAHKKYDPYIKLLLRSYSGIFDGYVKINEKELAKRAGLQVAEIKKILQQLDQHEVISYIPQTDQPQLTFLTGRVNQKDLRISKQHYDERKHAAVKRMEAVIYYASTTRKCRSQLLLAYFGEKDAYRCGICDVCLERNKLELSKLEFEQVSHQIKEMLHEQTMTLDELVHAIKNSREDKVIKVIQWLLDNDKMKYNDDHKLRWSK